MTRTKINKRELEISYSNIEDAIASFLISMSAINDDENIIEIDIPVTNKDGIVKITVSTVKA